MTPFDRLEIVATEQNRTVSKLIQMVGRNKSIVSQLRTGKKSVSEDLAKAIQAYLGYSKDWVLTGEGPKRVPGNYGSMVYQEPGNSIVPELKENQHTIIEEMKSGELVPAHKALLFLSQLSERDAQNYVPYYDVEITAGQIEQYFDGVEEVPEGYVYAPQYRGCVMCNVKGNSMYNLIYPGARLYVYQLHDKKYIDFGQIYLVVLNAMRVLKYIRRHPTDDTKVTLASHNKDHDDWDVDRADIISLFQVKGFENQTTM